MHKILDGYSLQDVSNWADEIRSDQKSLYKSFAKWHYMEVEEGKSVEKISYIDGWPKNIQQAIEYCVKELKEQPKGAKLQRAILLKMLVHLVADAHQPLHVGNGKDKGANQCYVRWFYSKFPSTLHQVWDSKLVDSQHLSYSEYTDYLDHISSTDKKVWQNSSVSQWLQESRDLHMTIYPKKAKITPDEYCKSSRNAVEYSKMPVLSYKYQYEMRPVVEKRLQQAAIRLAGVLNSIVK